VFLTISHFNTSLIFSYKAEATQVKGKAPCLARKYWKSVEISDSEKQSSLFWYIINYGRKKFIVQAPGAVFITLDFIINLRMDLIGYNVCYLQAFPA
jgi:hypothetical protein